MKQWSKDIKVGDEVSYSDVNLWFTHRGIVESTNESWTMVKWKTKSGFTSYQSSVKELTTNLISWR